MPAWVDYSVHIRKREDHDVIEEALNEYLQRDREEWKRDRARYIIIRIQSRRRLRKRT